MQQTKRWVIGICLFFCTATAWASDIARLPFYEAHQGDKQIFILGTMHVGETNTELRPEIKEALTKSSKLVQELSTDEMLRSGLTMLTMMCSDACLRRQISEASYQKLAAGSGAMLASLGALEQMPAWMVSTILASSDYEKAGYTAMGGTELKLKSLWGSRATVGLETAEEQLSIFAEMSDSVQREMLESYINTPEEKRLAMVKKMYGLWQRGDAEAIYQWYLQMSKEEGLSSTMVSEIDTQLIVKRNRLFVERLQPHITSGKPVFLAVGALHLGGPQGVLALLKKQGYSISAR